MAAASGPIPWEDPAIAAKLTELRALPGGDEAVDKLGSEFLAANFIATRPSSSLQDVLSDIRQTVEWRKTSGALTARHSILNEGLKFHDIPHMAEVSACIPLFESIAVGGVDRFGLPWALRFLGMADLDALFEKVSEEGLALWQIYVSESRSLFLDDYLRRTGRLGGVTVIQDVMCPDLLAMYMKNRSKMNAWKKIVKLADVHYPGIFSSLRFVNAPWVIHAILQASRPILPRRISDSIQVFGVHNTPGMMQALIEPQSLPQFYGGEAVNEDVVPNFPAFPATGDFESELLVRAGECDECSLEMEKDAEASYAFHVAGSASQDINFRCRFEADGIGAGVVDASPMERIKEATGGNFIAPAKGRLIMTFDNSYSWVNSKTIRYELEVLPPRMEMVPTTSTAPG